MQIEPLLPQHLRLPGFPRGEAMPGNNPAAGQRQRQHLRNIVRFQRGRHAARQINQSAQFLNLLLKLFVTLQRRLMRLGIQNRAGSQTQQRVQELLFTRLQKSVRRPPQRHHTNGTLRLADRVELLQLGSAPNLFCIEVAFGEPRQSARLRHTHAAIQIHGNQCLTHQQAAHNRAQKMRQQIVKSQRRTEQLCRLKQRLQSRIAQFDYTLIQDLQGIRHPLHPDCRLCKLLWSVGLLF